MPKFDFKFDGVDGPEGAPDMKALRDRMQQWRRDLRDRMQRRSNGAPGGGSGDRSPDTTPAKPTRGKVKTLDA